MAGFRNKYFMSNFEFDIDNANELCMFCDTDNETKEKAKNYVLRLLYLQNHEDIANIKHKPFFVSHDCEFHLSVKDLHNEANNSDEQLMIKGRECMKKNAPMYKSEYIITAN